MEDLSPALAVLPKLGAEVDLAMALRVARIAVETLQLRPSDQAAALTAAREFYSAAGNGHSVGQVHKGEPKHA